MIAGAGAGVVAFTADAWAGQPTDIREIVSAELLEGDFTLAVRRAVGEVGHLSIPRSRKVYRARSAASVQLPRDTVIDFNDAKVLFDPSAHLSLEGLLIEERRLLLADTVPLTTSLHVTGPQDLAPGDILVLDCPRRPSPQWDDRATDCVEIARIDGNLVHLKQPLNFAYRANEVTLSIYRPHRLQVSRVKFAMTAAAREPLALLSCKGLRGVHVAGYQFSAPLPFDAADNISRIGLQIYRCIDTVLQSGHAQNMSYPVLIEGGARHCTAENFFASGCHHSVEAANWACDVTVRGLRAVNCYQAVSAHPSFKVSFENFEVLADHHLSNLRTIGGTLRSGKIQTSAGDSAGHAQFQDIRLYDEFQYIANSADFLIEDVYVEAPNRRDLPPIAIQYGRNVIIRFLDISSFGASTRHPNQIENLVIGLGNRFNSSPFPSLGANRIRNRMRCAPPLVPAILQQGRYHIDLRTRAVNQTDRYLRCYGPVLANARNGTPFSLRIHTNAFAGIDRAALVVGSLMLRASAVHKSAGRYATALGRWSFCFQSDHRSTLTYRSEIERETSTQHGATLWMDIISATFSGASRAKMSMTGSISQYEFTPVRPIQ